MLSLSIGQSVRLNDNGIHAIVKYYGETQFAPGLWVGVELATMDGKNDGSVHGVRYFNCEMGKGMFLRPASLTTIMPTLPKKPKIETKKTSRPASVGSILVKRSSVGAEPISAKQINLNSSSPNPHQIARNGSHNPNALRVSSKKSPCF